MYLKNVIMLKRKGTQLGSKSKKVAKRAAKH